MESIFAPAAGGSSLYGTAGTGLQQLTGTGAKASSLASALATSGTSSTGTTSSTTSSSTSSDITANDFLTLLVTELQNQDPTQPQDPNQYIDQLVNVNSLQQLIGINSGISSLDTASGVTPSGQTGGSGSPANTNAMAATAIAAAASGTTPTTGSTTPANNVITPGSVGITPSPFAPTIKTGSSGTGAL